MKFSKVALLLTIIPASTRPGPSILDSLIFEPNDDTQQVRTDMPLYAQNPLNYMIYFFSQSAHLLIISLIPRLFEVFWQYYANVGLEIVNELTFQTAEITSRALFLENFFTWLNIVLGIQGQIYEGVISDESPSFLQFLSKTWNKVIELGAKDTASKQTRGKGSPNANKSFLGDLIDEFKSGINALMGRMVYSPVQANAYLKDVSWLLIILMQLYMPYFSKMVTSMLSKELNYLSQSIGCLHSFMHSHYVAHPIATRVRTDAMYTMLNKNPRYYLGINAPDLALTMSELPNLLNDVYMHTYVPLLKSAVGFGFTVLAETVYRNKFMFFYALLILMSIRQNSVYQSSSLTELYQEYGQAREALDATPSSLLANAFLIQFANPDEEVQSFLDKRRKVEELQQKITKETDRITEAIRAQDFTVGGGSYSTRFCAQVIYLLGIVICEGGWQEICSLRSLFAFIGYHSRENFPPNLAKGFENFYKDANSPTFSALVLQLIRLFSIYRYVLNMENDAYKSTIKTLINDLLLPFAGLRMHPKLSQSLETVYADSREGGFSKDHFKVSNEPEGIIVKLGGFSYPESFKKAQKKKQTQTADERREFFIRPFAR